MLELSESDKAKMFDILSRERAHIWTPDDDETGFWHVANTHGAFHVHDDDWDEAVRKFCDKVQEERDDLHRS